MPINVIVFKPYGRPFFHAQWVDPVTGRKKTRSTGARTEQAAQRFAGSLERSLRDGTFRDRSRITWKTFRERVESEYVPAKADGTLGKVRAMLNAIERHVDPKRLASLDADQISRFQKALRDEDELAEPTIKGHLAYLHAALEWGRTVGLLAIVPEIVMPTRTASRKGRPPTGEEFDRFLEAVDGVVNKRQDRWLDPTLERITEEAKRAESWKFLLKGLWSGGLRLSESLALDWEDDTQLCVDLTGRRPMLRIRAEAEKGYQERLLPMAPEFAELLYMVPEADRTGKVFRPVMQRDHGDARHSDTVSAVICSIGEAAAIKVSTNAAGRVKYASAHDLRRAFGTRWARRVMPAVLQQLMRHKDIQTTMTYYVEMEAEATADAIWGAMPSVSESVSDGADKHAFGTPATH